MTVIHYLAAFILGYCLGTSRRWYFMVVGVLAYVIVLVTL